MGNYSDLSSTFKLIHGAESVDSTKRNMAIFAMLLNGLGIPDKFHEFITAVFLSGNWEEVKGYEQMTLKRMARNLSSLSNSVFETVYNRLKKNGPAFLQWQEEKGLEVILAVKDREPNSLKTRVKYAFPYYPHIVRLFSLDKSVTQKEIRRMVEDTCKALPRVQSKKREVRKRRPESYLSSGVSALAEALDGFGSSLEFQAEFELEMERRGFSWKLIINDSSQRT